MAENTAGFGLFGKGKDNIFLNEFFFETLLMLIIIMWLLKWLFGFDHCFN